MKKDFLFPLGLLKTFQRSCNLLSQLTTTVEINCCDKVYSKISFPGKMSSMHSLFFSFLFHTRFFLLNRNVNESAYEVVLTLWYRCIRKQSFEQKGGEEKRKVLFHVSVSFLHVKSFRSAPLVRRHPVQRIHIHFLSFRPPCLSRAMFSKYIVHPRVHTYVRVHRAFKISLALLIVRREEEGDKSL